MNVFWDTLDWRILDDLRRRFLERAPVGAAASGGSSGYWRSEAELDNYDFTYAQRIGWKWDAVLRELSLRQWQPPAGPLLDWGCGSGIAGRSVVSHYGAARFGTLYVHDRSPLAMRFALDAAGRVPGVEARPWSGGADEAAETAAVSIGTLVVSHVVNELDAAGRAELGGLLARAAAVLWVEPGTYADSRALIAFREEWLGEFDVVAPCTHAARCGMLNAHNDRHWCHHFAAPPAGILANAQWVRFAQRAGIDLRSLPYSFLALEQRPARAAAPGTPDDAWARVIGAPRLYKGFAKVLACSREDVRETEMQARDNPEILRAYKKDAGPILLRGHADAKERLVAEESL